MSALMTWLTTFVALHSVVLGAQGFPGSWPTHAEGNGFPGALPMKAEAQPDYDFIIVGGEHPKTP